MIKQVVGRIPTQSYYKWLLFKAITCIAMYNESCNFSAPVSAGCHVRLHNVTTVQWPWPTWLRLEPGSVSGRGSCSCHVSCHVQQVSWVNMWKFDNGLSMSLPLIINIDIFTVIVLKGTTIKTVRLLFVLIFRL